MANHLQAVAALGGRRLIISIAALLLLNLAAEGQFSHQVHLKAKIDCRTCHTAAASSTRASDNLLPAAAVCASCHKDNRTWKAREQRQLTVTRFNHALHAKLGNIAPIVRQAIEAKKYLSDPGNLNNVLAGTTQPCAACHRGLEHSAQLTEKPAAFPAMADCLVCHNSIDPPFSCAKCHDESAKLKPATHTSDWIDVHSSGKANLDKPSCAVCHGRGFTCLGCH
ncbi:MAG TPA: cytochrome c3 family protein [Bryobacteraceae bacterium]|nr:cytochrome c3 family protein [Bryobacteraceae bacterium]